MTWRGDHAGYLFDLDGTLVDTAPDLHVALNRTLSKHQFAPVEESLTRHWVGHGARAMIAQALAHQHHNGAEHIAAEMFTDFLSFYRQHIADLSQPYPGVVATLAQLQARGAKLAVVTNKSAALSERLLSTLGLLDCFDVLVGGDTCAQPKPHPAPIEYCLKQLKLERQQVLFVGDSDTDVQAAKNANVKVVCLRNGYHHGQDVTALGADGVIDTCGELLS